MTHVQLLRALRLSIALNLLPFVRSCDDASGLQETIGFPVPFTAYQNHQFGTGDVDWLILLVNIAILFALFVILLKQYPSFAHHLLGWKVIFATALLWVFNVVANVFVFVAIMLLVTLISFVAGIPDGWTFVDVAARFTSAAFLLGVAYVLSSKTEDAAASAP